ncbi:MAG: LVIVD repeat-containing protein [Gemmatimonadales bacterium]
MISAAFARRLGASLLSLALAACATSKLDLSTTAPTPDPRVGLRAGWMNAAEASWNLHLISTTPPSADFMNKSTPGNFNLINSDIAFSGNYVIQGNFSGYQVWDISKPTHPTLRMAYVCPGSQSDVSVYKNLMFVSGEATNGRTDCGIQGVADTVSKERARGIRIFDITDISHPKPITIVQTCRGSHTNTLVTPPDDPDNIYIYVSGSAPVRSSNELPGCSSGQMAEDSNTALFRIEVIKVPLAHPEQAAIVSSPRIFNDLAAPARHGETPADSAEAAQRRAAAEAARVARGDTARRARPVGPPPTRTGPTQCHDITVYPAIGLAGGACAGYGLLLDIRDAAHPVRIGAVADSNFSFWHSATFNNDGTKVLFSDEWGGGLQPRCRATDKPEWGADAIFTLSHDTMTFQSYYKLPAPQTSVENCVAHNGSLIPIPGRDIMVQGWYQGGISVFDWTDAAHPKEIGFFDRGPMDATKLVAAGSWSAYWYNGLIISSEISRGLDIFELKPSGFISQNEIDAAKTVRFDFLNVQDQPKLVWPASFALAGAYLDQLARTNGLAADKIAVTRLELARIEKLPAAARRDPLHALAMQLHTDARSAADQMKAHTLAGAVGALADAQH